MDDALLAAMQILAKRLSKGHRIRRWRTCHCNLTGATVDTRPELSLGGTHLCKQRDRIEGAIEVT